MNKNISVALAIVALGALGFAAWHYSNKGAVPTASAMTVATVDGNPITKSALLSTEAQIATQQGVATSSAEVRVALQAAALDSLIGQQLVTDAAAKSGITASSTLVDQQMTATKSQFPSQAEYEKALSQQGMTEDQLRSQISKNLTINAFLNQKLNLSSATATAAEIQTTYKQLSAGSTSTPPLSAVRTQVAQYVVQQKQQALINSFITQLRAAADIKILISTSTPLN